MKRTILAIAGLLAVTSWQAGATVITFDDLGSSAGGTPIANGYQGLNWNNFYFLSTALYGVQSGYINGTVSGPNVAFNAGGSEAITSSGAAFDLDSAYLTGAWNNGLQVQVIGKSGATVLYNNTYTVNETGPSLINFNYLGVTEVDFISSGGTHVNGLSGNGEHFAMDNLAINEPVPEPTTVIVGALLLLPFGVGMIRSLRKTAKA